MTHLVMAGTADADPPAGLPAHPASAPGLDRARLRCSHRARAADSTQDVVGAA